MIKNILLISVLTVLLSSCGGEGGLSDFEKAQAEPGWKESGLYAENQGRDNKHLSDLVGVKSKLFVRTGEGLVYTKNNSE